MFDLIIKNGRVVDGTGRPSIQADIAVVGNRIEHVGQLPDGVIARNTIDASGHIVSPGFIDIHTHSDCSLLINRLAESSVRQGVTTELVGNCGMGCAPINDPDKIPLVVLEYRPEIETVWQTFGEWLEILEKGGTAINVAALVAHGPVRMSVLGTAERAPDPSELQEMVNLVEASMEAGAFGFSSGLEYTPGKNADQFELSTLAAIAGRYEGIYATHIRNRDYEYKAAVEEAITTANSANVSLQISHVSPRWGAPKGAAAWSLDKIDHAFENGIDVWFDNHPYILGRGLVMASFPAEVFDGGRDQLRMRLQSPAYRQSLWENIRPQWKFVNEERWDLLLVFEAPNSKNLEGRTIEEISNATGKAPWDVVCDLLMAEWQNPSALYWSAPIHKQEDVDASFLHPRGIIMSDGSAVAPYGPYGEVQQIYAYGWASHVLRRYVRERGLLSLEQAIHKMSGLPAERLGIRDRGVITPGYHADLVIFHPDDIQDRATFDHPIGYPEGIRDVWVNGVHTIANGEHTGALEGKVLRRQ
jgi:N-acyl-D-aspartate/D-glutamate deacylase